MTDPPDWYRPPPRLTPPVATRRLFGKRMGRFMLFLLTAPLVLGFAATFLIGWPYVSAAQTGLMWSAGSLGVLGIVAARWYRGPEPEQTFLKWKINMWHHRRLLALGAAIMAVYGLGQAAVDSADWFYPYDRVDVTITRTYAGRSGDTIYTTTGTFKSPPFVSFDATPGPAMLTLGHVSRYVLLVEQPATP
jgi:hypothetical protein